MNSTILISSTIFILALGFRFYSNFLAKKVARLDDSRDTPAVKLDDRVDYVPTGKWHLFFYHYATIAGAGVIVGPTLAAQYGWLPCLPWILTATCLAGGVHDFMIMFLSVRHGGKSIAEIARSEVGRVSWVATMIAVYFMVIVAIAGMGMGLISALERNPQSTFVVLCTIPIAILLYACEGIFRLSALASSMIGVALLILAVALAPILCDAGLLSPLNLSRDQIIIIIALYSSVAAVLPIERLLAPRNRLSGYIKASVAALLALTLLFIVKNIKMPPLTDYAFIGGPIVSGPLWPFLLIIITCGAISGWHSLCCSGVTPKCIAKETDIKVVAYGGWLLESMIAAVALVLACLLRPQDYFAINASPSVYANLGMEPIELQRLSNELGFNLAGRTGGVVSFSVSAAEVLADLFRGLHLRQLYLFMIVWTALFIMPIMDHGTRMARYFIQDALGITVTKPREWWVSTLILTGAAAFLWSYLLQTGTIGVIWPIFGVCNQLMASIGLVAVTSHILRRRRPIYGLITFWPVLVFASASIHGAIIKITQDLIPTGTTPAYIQTAILILFIVLFMVTLIDASRVYIRCLHAKTELNEVCQVKEERVYPGI